MSRLVRQLLCAGTAAALFAGSAGAQLLPVQLPGVGVPLPNNVPVAGPVLGDILGDPQVQQAIRPTLHSVSGLTERAAESGPGTLLQIRRLRLQELIRANRATVEGDGNGLPVRRGILVIYNPDPAALQLALRAGFRIAGEDRSPELAMRSIQLAVPAGLNARAGLKLLERVAPQLEADFDHLFEPAGGSLAPLSAALAVSSGAAGGRTVGMIDGAVASHPSLAGRSIEQNGFAGPPRPTGHGTAVASLLVGSHGPFRGPAAGARLFVADVYGGNRSAGSASAIVRALAWLSTKRPEVINVSLVGPQNKLVERAILAVRARGTQVVAAVGNDGPAAPPQYPASYPGVLAVTAVDRNGRALPEAGRAAHLDFAAPGADMAAAIPGQGYARVRGTSFAAPLAAARLLVAGSPMRLAAEARPGRGRVGRGIVCGECRVDPRAVGAR